MKARQSSEQRSTRRLALTPVSARDPSKLRGEIDELGRALADAQRRLEAEVETRTALESQIAERAALERQLLRKQLHDGLGQLLTSMCFLISSVRTRLKTDGFASPPELDELAALLNKAVAESRSIAAKFEPPSPAPAWTAVPPNV